MAPKDTSLALAMISFIVHFSWNWIGLAISDNDRSDTIERVTRNGVTMDRKATPFLSTEG